MSIEQTDLVDFVGIDNLTGDVVLTISDQLDWTDVRTHLLKLQDKLNTYLRFCEGGELYQSYPAAAGRHVVFLVVWQHPIAPEGEAFFETARTALEGAGFGFQISSVE